MKQKIVVDGLSLLSTMTGIGRYTYEISNSLQSLCDFELVFFYGYYSKKLIRKNEKAATKSFLSILTKLSFVKKTLRSAAYLRAKFCFERFDLYWQPNFIPSDSIRAKRIVTTLHDLSFLHYPDFHPKERIEHFKKNFFTNIYKSDVVITASYFTKDEIAQKLKFSKEKIEVIYHGIDHERFRVIQNPELDFEVPKKFILCVGSLEPRKNLFGAIKAYNALDEKTKKEYKLLIVGFYGWSNDEIVNLIDREKENIRYLGYVGDDELAKLYNKASLFLYPSLYEGFGLPVIEAMACATPVVCSFVASLPEVGGDSVLYCDPNDTEDIKIKIQTLLYDEKLQKQLIKKGLDRAAKFSWQASAKKHAQLFKRLMEEGR